MKLTIAVTDACIIYPKSLSETDKSVLYVANKRNACVLSSDKVLRNCRAGVGAMQLSLHKPAVECDSPFGGCGINATNHPVVVYQLIHDIDLGTDDKQKR